MARPAERSSGSFQFRQYQIKTFSRVGKASARAFIGDKATRIVAEAKTEQDAVRGVEQQLTAQDVARRAQRLNDIPCSAEFGDAFAVLGSKVTKTHWKMLLAHMEAPDATLTWEGLAQAAGYANYRLAIQHYGKLGHLIAEQLEFAPPVLADGTTNWTLTLAEAVDHAGVQEREWAWTMRPELAGWLRSRPIEVVPVVVTSGNL